MAEVVLIRRETFCASHRLHCSTWSEERNQQIFGKCYRPNGHGHNYELKVFLRGTVHPESGILITLAEAKEKITSAVLDKVDHRHLNLDVPEFKTLNPTTENLAIVIWNWLIPVFGSLLYEVQLQETENNTVSYRGA